MKRPFTSLAVALLLVLSASAQVTVSPVLLPKPQFFTPTGAVCAACTITTYTAGTTSLLATYTDSTQNVQNQNPLTLNSAGYPQSEIWFGPYTYKVVLKDALNVPIWTVDNVKSTQQLLSVIYSTANNWTATQTFDGSHTVTGLPTPSATSDAAPKSYVDTQVGNVFTSANTYTGANAFSNGNTFSGSNTFSAATTFTNIALQDVTYNNAFYAIGDSITACFGVVTSSNCYVNRIATAKNWTATAQGVSGDGIADMSLRTFVNPITSSTVTTLLCCVNDMRNNGSGGAGTLSAAQRDTWARAVQANLLQAAIPDTQKIWGDSHGSAVGGVTYGGGGFVTTGLFNNHLYKATAAGATATFSIYGSTIYLVSAYQLTNTSTYKITLDGVDQSITVNGTAGTTLSTASGAFASFNAHPYGPYAYRFSGLSKTLHSVVLTVLSADASNPAYFMLGASSSGATSKAGPYVYVGDTIRFSTTLGIGYAVYGGSDAAVAAHNDLLREVQSELATDGLHVAYVTVDANGDDGYFPLVGSNTQTDGVHPADVGHGLLANAFLAEMSGLAAPRERGLSQVFRGVPLCTFTGVLANGGCPFGAIAGDGGAAETPTVGKYFLGTDGVHFIKRIGNNIQFGGVGISLMQFGGTASTFPALKFAGSPAKITVRNADDTADAALQASTLTLTGGTAPIVITPTVGQAACIKAAGPPVQIGYCSTTVGAGGACTCN